MGPEQSALETGKSAKQRRKKDKVRSAWIAFVGRILAQVIGAAATIAFGLLLLNKYQVPESEPTPVRRANPAGVSRSGATVTRTAGEISVAVLPLENFSGDPRQEYLGPAPGIPGRWDDRAAHHGSGTAGGDSHPVPNFIDVLQREAPAAP